jgi:hypothetical protein
VGTHAKDDFDVLSSSRGFISHLWLAGRAHSLAHLAHVFPEEFCSVSDSVDEQNRRVLDIAGREASRICLYGRFLDALPYPITHGSRAMAPPSGNKLALTFDWEKGLLQLVKRIVARESSLPTPATRKPIPRVLVISFEDNRP